MHLCPLCNSFAGQSFSAVVRHIGDIHRHDPGLNIQCGQCPQTYHNFQLFRSHVYRKHRDTLHCDHPSDQFDGNTSNHDNPLLEIDSENPMLDPMSPQDPAEVEYQDHARSTPTDRDGDRASRDVDRHVPVRFIMKIRKEYRIPLQDVTALCYSSIESVKDTLFSRIEEVDNAEQMKTILYESMDLVSSPFKDLDTQYKQTSYYKEHLDYQVFSTLHWAQ